MAENNPNLNQQLDPEIQLRQASINAGEGGAVLRRGIKAALIGPERSGKAEQGAKMAHKYCVCYLNTKNLLKDEVKAGTPLGQKIQQYFSGGDTGHVDTDVVLQLIEKNLETESCKFGFVIDGFPRNIQEAEKFDAFLAKRKTPLDTVVEFTEPNKWMFTGILNGKNQVGKYYSKKDCYATVDSTKPFSQVSAKVDELFGKYVKNSKGGLYTNNM